MPQASLFTQQAIPLVLPAPGILYLVVDPIDRTSDAEEEKAIRVGSHLYLTSVLEFEELLVHLRREAATSAEGELVWPAPLALRGSCQRVVEVLDDVLIDWHSTGPAKNCLKCWMTDDATDRNVSPGAGIDAEQVALINGAGIDAERIVAHAAEILLHRQERLPCHGRDRRARAAEPEPVMSARPFDCRVAPAPKPVAQLECLRPGKRDGGQGPGPRAAVGHDSVEGLCGVGILDLLLGDGSKPGLFGGLRQLSEVSSLC